MGVFAGQRTDQLRRALGQSGRDEGPLGKTFRTGDRDNGIKVGNRSNGNHNEGG